MFDLEVESGEVGCALRLTSIWLLAYTGLTLRGRSGFTNSRWFFVLCAVFFSDVAKHSELLLSIRCCVSVAPCSQIRISLQEVVVGISVYPDLRWWYSCLRR